MESWPGMVIKHLLLKEAGAVRLKKQNKEKTQFAHDSSAS